MTYIRSISEAGYERIVAIGKKLFDLESFFNIK